MTDEAKTPSERAQKARDMVNREVMFTGKRFDSMHPDDREAALIDVVTDLLHLAYVENLDPEAIQRQAWHHFKAELHEAGVE